MTVVLYMLFEFPPKNSIAHWVSYIVRTEFTSPITKSTSPGLLDMPLFAHCIRIQ